MSEYFVFRTAKITGPFLAPCVVASKYLPLQSLSIHEGVLSSFVFTSLSLFPFHSLFIDLDDVAVWILRQGVLSIQSPTIHLKK